MKGLDLGLRDFGKPKPHKSDPVSICDCYPVTTLEVEGGA